jgi:hypothetical protein
MSICLGAGDLKQVVHGLGSSVACSTSNSDTLRKSDHIDGVDFSLAALHDSLCDCELSEFEEGKFTVH